MGKTEHHDTKARKEIINKDRKQGDEGSDRKRMRRRVEEKGRRENNHSHSPTPTQTHKHKNPERKKEKKKRKDPRTIVLTVQVFALAPRCLG